MVHSSCFGGCDGQGMMTLIPYCFSFYLSRGLGQNVVLNNTNKSIILYNFRLKLSYFLIILIKIVILSYFLKAISNHYS